MHETSRVVPQGRVGVGVTPVDTADIEQLTARLQAACLNTEHQSQTATESNIAAAFRALHMQVCGDDC